MTHCGVVQLVDSLETGGTERVAVNLANCLAKRGYRSHIVIGRAGGGLSDLVRPDVGRLHLRKQRRIDPAALHRLVSYVQEHEIRILHAHSSSIFTARLVSFLHRDVRILWHDHYGLKQERSTLLYRMAVRNVDGVISVSKPLADWARDKLLVPVERVWYIPNFADVGSADAQLRTDLPGAPGHRIVCVANFRPQKDHLTLIRAMAVVLPAFPEAHLLLIGSLVDPEYLLRVQSEIRDLGLGRNVSILGLRKDIHAILRNCDIGVLSSISEGLPLALLEYGACEMAAVATSVGQCAEVLDDGQAGLLVPPQDCQRLADAIIALLRSAECRRQFGRLLRQRVNTVYGSGPVMDRICGIYDRILN